MILLDTHILIWWVSQSNLLSKTALDAINHEIKSNGSILVSSITAWEVSMLVEKGRLSLSMDVDSWINTVGQIDQVQWLPLTNKVLIESTRLPGDFHKDPVDRMIIAQARAVSSPLITADEKILKYRHIRTIF